MKKAKKATGTPELYRQLKAKAAKLGLVVYGYLVTDRGVGIVYSDELKVYAYAKTFRAALQYELKVLNGQEDCPPKRLAD